MSDTIQTNKDTRKGIMFNQASKVIAKFGGHSKLAKLVGLNRVQIYRWGYPREKGGTGGLIPTNAFAKVLNAARVEGILLTMEDLMPEKMPEKMPRPTPAPEMAAEDLDILK